MIAIGLLFVRMLCDFFKPRPRLEAEILILRHQLNVLQQRTPRRRLHLRWVDPSLTLPGCFSGVFPVKRAGEASGSEAPPLIAVGIQVAHRLLSPVHDPTINGRSSSMA